MEANWEASLHIWAQNCLLQQAEKRLLCLPLQDAKQLAAVSIWVGNLALQVGVLLLIDCLTA